MLSCPIYPTPRTSKTLQVFPHNTYQAIRYMVLDFLLLCGYNALQWHNLWNAPVIIVNNNYCSICCFTSLNNIIKYSLIFLLGWPSEHKSFSMDSVAESEGTTYHSRLFAYEVTSKMLPLRPYLLTSLTVQISTAQSIVHLFIDLIFPVIILIFISQKVIFVSLIFIFSVSTK